MTKEKDLTIVKKYANRRLYDTGRSSYVTLGDLAEMLREGHDFKVIDAKTNKNITHSVLIQIIVEQETNDNTPDILPQQFLKELIKFYGTNMQRFVPIYLNQAMLNFSQAKDQIQSQMEQSFGSLMPKDTIQNTEQTQTQTPQTPDTDIMLKMLETFISFEPKKNSKD